MARCVMCDKEFDAVAQGRFPTAYCSHDCRQRAYIEADDKIKRVEAAECRVIESAATLGAGQFRTQHVYKLLRPRNDFMSDDHWICRDDRGDEVAIEGTKLSKMALLKGHHVPFLLARIEELEAAYQELLNRSAIACETLEAQIAGLHKELAKLSVQTTEELIAKREHSLRDWFAAQYAKNFYVDDIDSAAAIARDAYLVADAMLRQRDIAAGLGRDPDRMLKPLADNAHMPPPVRTNGEAP